MYRSKDDIIIVLSFQLSRCGHFERVYPLANFDRYRKFFEIEVSDVYVIIFGYRTGINIFLTEILQHSTW